MIQPFGVFTIDIYGVCWTDWKRINLFEQLHSLLDFYTLTLASVVNNFHNVLCCMNQGRQIFRPKIAIWINFWGSCNGKCWYILWPFGLFYGPLIYFMTTWYTLFRGNLVYFSPFWKCLVCECSVKEKQVPRQFHKRSLSERLFHKICLNALSPKDFSPKQCFPEWRLGLT
jgi:hypothetical protein